MSVEKFRAGTTVFKEGDNSDFAYLIQKGRVKIIKNVPEKKQTSNDCNNWRR